MTAEAASNVVVPLRPIDGPEHPLARGTAGRTGMLSGFDPGLTVMRDWPHRMAVVVGQALHPNVVQVLSREGFRPVVTSVDRAAEVVRALSPVSVFALGPDVFDSDASVDAVRSWRRASPAARVKLVYAAEDRSPEVLVRAIRAGVTDVVDVEDVPGLTRSLRAGIAEAGTVRERVLAIGAHPDDVEIGCGATLLDHRMRGDRITILTLSQGAVGGATEARVHEAARTAEAVGAQLLFGDLPDTAIDEGIDTIRLIESVVRTLDPTVVYVHSAHDNHQDHRAVSTATRSATRGVRRVLAYQSPSATNDFSPTQFVAVDATVRRKVEVLQMFASQDGRTYLEPEMVIAGARYWARHLGATARYAEPYEVIRSVGELRHAVSSPVYDAGDRADPLGSVWGPHELHTAGPLPAVGGPRSTRPATTVSEAATASGRRA